MSKFMLGRKVGMTQIFNDDGVVIPVTVIEAGPLSVVQKKTVETDGYNAVKVGYLDVPEKRVTKPLKGQFSKAKVSPKKYLREFRTEEVDKYEVGQEIKVGEMFEAGDRVDVSGISKGKGYQGVVKRHGQKIGRKTHGSKFHRAPGSMGSNTDPGRVFKGKKLPGRMGGEKVTVLNLDVVRVDADRNLLLVKGAVPGPRNGLVTVKATVKSGR